MKVTKANYIITIGYLSRFCCYLNISEEEAIARYMKAEDLSREEVMRLSISTIILDDKNEFEAYEVWEKVI